MNKKRLAIWNKTSGKCIYCGCDLPEKGWHSDHVKPIQRKLQYADNRGLFTTNESYHPDRDTETNKVPCCPSCNIQKGSLSVEQFRDKIAAFIYSLNHYHTQYAVAKRYGLITETEVSVVFWFEKKGLSINGDSENE